MPESIERRGARIELGLHHTELLELLGVDYEYHCEFAALLTKVSKGHAATNAIAELRQRLAKAA